MRQNKFFKIQDSFTLVELLVVIGILAILTAAVVIVLNPAELLKQSRDSKRTTDLASLNNAIKLLLTQNPDINLGSASTVYVSLPANDASCSNILSSLPSIPAGWQYRCTTAANLTKVDSTGWVPVSFSSAGGVASLPALPIDPQNSGAYYYSYIPGGSWEISTLFESKKYAQRAQSDAGIDPERLEVGSNLALWKDAYGLVGRWSLAQKDERLGPELAINGGFENWTGSFPAENPVGWAAPNATTTSNYVTNAGGKARIVCGVGGVYADVYLRLPSVVSAGKTYFYSVNVVNMASGQFQLRIGDFISSPFTTSGIKTGYVTVGSGSNFLIDPSAATCDITVDDVSLREVSVGDAASSNNGTSYGASYAQDQQGNANGAMSFNGTTNYVQLPDLDAYVANGFTASYWIKKPNEGIGNRWVFGSYSGWTPGQTAFLVWTDDNTKILNFYIQGSASTKGCGASFANYYDSWTLVTVTYDKNSYKTYINGAVACSGAFAESVSSGSRTNWYIADTGSPAAGSIADVRLYSRALSAAEIQAIYSATK
jgi:type II secretory pathway pseudopilin PulG